MGRYSTSFMALASLASRMFRGAASGGMSEFRLHKALKWGDLRHPNAVGTEGWRFDWTAFNRSKYEPHVGNYECERRVRQMATGHVTKQAMMTAKQWREYCAS